MTGNQAPEGYAAVTPYLIVDDGAAALDFYVRAFGATERMRFETGDGRIGHAEFQIGDSVLKLASEYEEIQALSPSTLGSTTVSFVVYVENVDETFARALAEGAEEVRPVANQFYGDRAGRLRDPFGHEWVFSAREREVPAEQIAARMKEFFPPAGSGGA